MFKRVFLVLTLLFAQSVFGQDASQIEITLDKNTQVSLSPVVAVESATGSVEQDESSASQEVASTTPAEAVEITESTSTESLIVTGPGASSTSSTSPASTSVETEESTSTTPTVENTSDKFFSLAFAGFEQFVEKVFGWQ